MPVFGGQAPRVQPSQAWGPRFDPGHNQLRLIVINILAPVSHDCNHNQEQLIIHYSIGAFPNPFQYLVLLCSIFLQFHFHFTFLALTSLTISWLLFLPICCQFCLVKDTQMTIKKNDNAICTIGYLHSFKGLVGNSKMSTHNN